MFVYARVHNELGFPPTVRAPLRPLSQAAGNHLAPRSPELTTNGHAVLHPPYDSSANHGSRLAPYRPPSSSSKTHHHASLSVRDQDCRRPSSLTSQSTMITTTGLLAWP